MRMCDVPAGRRSLSILAVRYFDGLTSSFNACSTRCVGSGRGRFYRHIPRTRALISSFGPWLAVRAAVSADATGHVVRSNRPSSFSGMKRVLEALR